MNTQVPGLMQKRQMPLFPPPATSHLWLVDGWRVEARGVSREKGCASLVLGQPWDGACWALSQSSPAKY